MFSLVGGAGAGGGGGRRMESQVPKNQRTKQRPPELKTKKNVKLNQLARQEKIYTSEETHQLLL